MEIPIQNKPDKKPKAAKGPGYLSENSKILKVRLDARSARFVVCPISVNEKRGLTTIFFPDSEIVMGVVAELQRTRVEAQARHYIQLHQSMRELTSRFASVNMEELMNFSKGLAPKKR